MENRISTGITFDYNNLAEDILSQASIQARDEMVRAGKDVKYTLVETVGPSCTLMDLAELALMLSMKSSEYNLLFKDHDEAGTRYTFQQCRVSERLAA